MIIHGRRGGGVAALAVLVVLVVLAIASGGALAQSTGGSIGGGDWSGGDDSPSSSTSSSSDDGYAHDYDGGGSGRRGSGGCQGPTVWQVGLLMVGVVWMVFGVFRHGSDDAPGAAGAATVAEADVTVLHLVLDAGVRPYVQRELDRIARTRSTGDQAGLASVLDEVAIMLRRLRSAWCYGTALNFPMTSMAAARSNFQLHAGRARATFRDELVRRHGETVTTAAAEPSVPRPDEGPGLVMVTLIVAARTQLHTIGEIGSGEDLRRALEVLSSLTPQTVIAAEIVWTPADPDDRMSSIELEAVLRGVPYFAIEGAMVGRAICRYCGGLGPAESVSCIHCGAPRGAA